MSQFLGRQDCMESLRKDLVDLQGATLDVFSRTGPVHFSSWKFPDKVSCNLDMVALLEQYDFVDGEEAFNQHSHIVLLELVIDRLLLLLQSFNAYIEQSGSQTEQSQQRGCLSVGLIVRNYWSNLMKFANPKGICNNDKKQTFDCDQAESGSVSSRGDFSTRCLSSTSSFMPQDHPPSSTTHSTHPKVDSRNAGCQTFQSSLVPCDACHQVQSTLRKTGDTLIELFQSEGLPSALQPLKDAVEDTLDPGQMTAADVNQWAREQFKDMRRLGKHLHDVRGTVQPLRDRLVAIETEREAAEIELEAFKSQLDKSQKEFKQEVEKHQANTVKLEISLQKAQRSLKKTEQRLKEELQQLKRETLCLKESNSTLKGKVAALQDTTQTLENEKNALQKEVRTLLIEEEARCKLQQRVRQLESQISETQLLLEKETAKYHSACRQQESMQAKQLSLLKQVDALDEECEDLQRQLDEREERQNDLHDQLQHMSEERERVQARLAQQQDLCSDLQKEKQTLETHAGELNNSVAELKECVQNLKEKERLLVDFPELSPLAQPQSTGDVLLDMQQQLQANSIRIKVLQHENATLHSSLVKLRESGQSNSTREASPQQSAPAEKQQSHLVERQKSPLLSSSARRLGYGDRGKEAGSRESGLESASPEDRVSIASPSFLQLHLQTLTLSPSATAKSHAKTHGGFLQSHSRNWNQRKK